jgi:Cof subfamily protein (haloacid dehalogenase superfamily)
VRRRLAAADSAAHALSIGALFCDNDVVRRPPAQRVLPDAKAHPRQAVRAPRPRATMPKYRLLAVDIDGTLVNSNHELTEATRTALLRAKRAGVEIVLASGRRYSRILPLVEPLELNVPLVTASGALVKRAADHATMYRAAFGPGALERCLGVIALHGHEAVLYADTYDQGYDFYCASTESRSPLLAEFFERNTGFGQQLPHLMTHPPEGIFAGFAMGTRDEMLALKSELARRLPGELYVHVLRSPRYTGYMCEIAPYGVSKWTAIERLARQWGIRPDEICAAGDDVNDIPMIAAAGLGVAMGNALDEVKAAADRIAPHHDDDGLVAVVDWLLE